MTAPRTLPPGEIGVFDAALAGDATAFGGAIALLGPGMESEEYERPNGGTDLMLHYAATGGSIRLRGGNPIVIRIPLRSDAGEPTYRDPAALIEGLDGESTRGEVEALLGEPDRASQIMDLYRYGDHYLRFDYERGRVEVVSMTISGVED